MTFVAAYSGSRSAPVVWAAGDVLVAVAMDAMAAAGLAVTSGKGLILLASKR